MKLTLILFALVLIGCKSYGQDTTSSRIKFSVGNSYFTYSYMASSWDDRLEYRPSDSLIVIYGDTIKVIRAMVEYSIKQYKHYDSIISAKDKLIRAAVAFTNESYCDPTVNCKWPAYQKLLKKEGYISSKRNKPRKPCK